MFKYGYHLCHAPSIYLNQWRNKRALLAIQIKALKKILHHSYTNVPYYHRLFDTVGIKPADITSVTDLQRIPILTKDIILANYPGNILAANVDWRHCVTGMTSGSSGKKLELVVDHEVTHLYRLMQLRQLLDVGYKPWDRVVYIRFKPPVTKIFLQKLGLLRRDYIPLVWTPEKQLSEIMRLKPKIIDAYPSVLYLLGKTIAPSQAKELKLKFLLSNSELLTKHVREYLENVFHCKVYDDYSCLEFSSIGFECRMQNLHVSEDNVIVEIVDSEGKQLPPGKQGRVVITALNNYAMPYIRYEIGDIGILSDENCPCGRTLPLFKSIIGRCDDFFVLPSGHLIDPQTVVFQIEVLPEVKEFRITQENDHKITVDIIPEQGVEFARIKDQIKKKLGVVFQNSLSVDVSQVTALERGTTGKHRSVFSHVSRTGLQPRST
jgi:phenylacetate-CoA ligase